MRSRSSELLALAWEAESARANRVRMRSRRRGWEESGGVPGIAALEKALLDGAGKGDDHLGLAAELGGFEIDAAMTDAASESCNESLPGRDMLAASRCLCGRAQLEMMRRRAPMHGYA